MKQVPEIKLFTLPEWFIIVAVVLGIGGYFAYPFMYEKLNAAVSADMQEQLADCTKKLAETQNQLAQEKIKRLENTINTNPDSGNINDELQQRVWDWEDYAKKASAYQDYLEGKVGSPKVERPNFPYTLL
jgi:hypothetical protein